MTFALSHFTVAERLLQTATAVAPRVATCRLALAILLLERLRYLEAHAIVADAIRRFPSNIELQLVLARVQFQLRRYEDAVKTIEAVLAMAPENAWAWYEFGRIASYSYERIGLADKAYERAADLCGSDTPLLGMIAQHFLYDLNYAKAAEYYERLFDADPDMRKDFVTCRYYATCMKARPRTTRAAEIIATGLESCRALAAHSKGEAFDLVKRDEWLLLSEARRPDEADAALRSIRGVSSGSARYGHRPDYLPKTPERLRLLADIVGSRDVFVLAQGPSFADFAARMHEFAPFDFAVATLNSFPPIEQELSLRINRHADVLLLTHPGSVHSWHAEFEEFLNRPKPNLAVMTRYALTALAEFGISEAEFVARHDERLLFVSPDRGPPIPARPLHFENGPTLSALIPLLLFGRPKRVFLFGADGGAHPGFSKRPYFFYDDYDSNIPSQAFLKRPAMPSFSGRPRQLQEANRRFRVNAVNADRIMGSALRSLEALFGIQPPPIFNVCRHSAHEAFPRIDIDTALATLAADGRERCRAGQASLNAPPGRPASLVPTATAFEK